MENEQSIEMKKNIWKYPTKKYLLSLRIFTCMSVSWVTFFRFNFCNSLIMFSFSTTGKKNWWQVLLYALIALMLEWLAHLSIALKVGNDCSF